MGHTDKLDVEIWSPLPPQASGVADYVAEQLETMSESCELTLVVENPEAIDAPLRSRYRVVAPKAADSKRLRVYHVGNSPLHRYIYLEALRVPGVVVLHEWNLHELLLGFAVTSNEFDAYRQTMRREHGERGSIAAETIASALGGKHWASVFPLNAEILSRALTVVSLSASTTQKVAARDPGGRWLHLPHHAFLASHAVTRAEARLRLGLKESDLVVLTPGLGTSSKALDVTRNAVNSIRSRVSSIVEVSVGGGVDAPVVSDGATRQLGRVDLKTLGDALLSADVVVALRFPSRGEASGVVMRSLAAGRATVISAGSTTDEELPQGVVGRIHPGPGEVRELAALLEFLLMNADARVRIEQLAKAVANERQVEGLTRGFVDFLLGVNNDRAALEERVAEGRTRGDRVSSRFREELEAVAANLGLAHLPTNVFEKLESLQ